MDNEDILSSLTIFAILIGPMIGIFMTRFIDSRREKNRRKTILFRDLMATRGLRLTPQHVSALNIVEVEFYDNQRVINAFRVYIEHLSSPMPTGEQERNRFIEKRNDGFIDLLYEIGSDVGLKFDKRDLQKTAYVPIGWGDDEDLQRGNSKMFNELLSGRRPLPIVNHLPHNPFPEPPNDD